MVQFIATREAEMEVCWPLRFTSGRTKPHQRFFLKHAYWQNSPVPQRFTLGVNNEKKKGLSHIP
jgi:hypothetical protein